jgi:hypothetical protein
MYIVRRNGQAYVYRTLRVEGRVVCRYVGSDAEVVARAEAARRGSIERAAGRAASEQAEAREKAQARAQRQELREAKAREAAEAREAIRRLRERDRRQLATMRAEAKAERARGRAEAEATVRRVRLELGARDREAVAAFGAVERTFRDHMHDLGYHRHHRGEWRRRRTMGSRAGIEGKANGAGGSAPSRPGGGHDPRAAAAAALARLGGRLAAGDPVAAEAVRTMYHAAPDLLAEAVGVDDLGLSALADRLAAAASDDALTRRVLELDVARQAERLAGDDPDPLVALLAKRTAVAALHGSVLELRLVAAVPAVAAAPRPVETLDRLAERADRRLQRSARTLATARRLLGRPEPVRVEAAIAANVEGTVDVAIGGRVDVEVGGTVAVDLQGAAGGEEAGVDGLEALLAERAGLGRRCVTAHQN